MTRSDLIGQLAMSNPTLSAQDVDEAVRTLLDAMSAALAHCQRIEIRGFGSFSLSHRPARVGRNPKTGEQVSVPAKRVPHFKAGKEMRERVDQWVQSQAG
ncbi:MAG TPA: integration host factor subunit beta [Burkholderiaceae bacterium]|nr:integration host factor subunit beta [Burkholderiaceae bacterium]